MKKLNIYLFLEDKNNELYVNNNPISRLLSNFKDIEIIILIIKNKLFLLAIFCFSINIIHNILYNYDEIIRIKYNEKNKDLAYNFYLNILINENPEVINYCYKLEYINNINNERNKIKDKFKLIFLAKCIIDLITNFRGTDEYNEDKNGEIL